MQVLLDPVRHVANTVGAHSDNPALASTQMVRSEPHPDSLECEAEGDQGQTADSYECCSAHLAVPYAVCVGPLQVWGVSP